MRPGPTHPILVLLLAGIFPAWWFLPRGSHFVTVLDVPASASAIFVGGTLVNIGTVWMDDAALEIVDKNEPATQRPPPGVRYNETISAAGLPSALQNGDFEGTTAIPADE